MDKAFHVSTYSDVERLNRYLTENESAKVVMMQSDHNGVILVIVRDGLNVL